MKQPENLNQRWLAEEFLRELGQQGGFDFYDLSKEVEPEKPVVVKK
jgi:hypothetical protein